MVRFHPSVPAEVVSTVSTAILYVASIGSNPDSVPTLVAQVEERPARSRGVSRKVVGANPA